MNEPQPQGAMHATGKVATSIVEGLKGQPALIFMLAMNVLVFGVTAWAGVKRSERFELILERCLPKAEALDGIRAAGGP